MFLDNGHKLQQESLNQCVVSYILHRTSNKKRAQRGYQQKEKKESSKACFGQVQKMEDAI